MQSRNATQYAMTLFFGLEIAFIFLAQGVFSIASEL
jgi:hypothetical protein